MARLTSCTYNPHDEKEVTALRLPEAVGPPLGEHLPPDHQLAHSLLGRQRQQAVVLAVQTHVQQVLLGEVVGDQVRLEGERESDSLGY